MSTSTVSAMAPDTPPLSQASRVINTFVAPTRTFSDLRRSASWWAPFLIICIISVVYAGVVEKQVGFERVNQNQIKMSPKAQERMERLPPEQQARQREIGATVSKYITYGFPLILLLFWAFIAALMLGTFNFALGAELNYKTSFAVVAYSAIPGSVVRLLLAIVALLAGIDPEGFNIQNPVATNLGHFVDFTTSPVLYRLLSAVDILQFWILALSAIGYSCLTKVRRGTSFAVVFGWYVLLTLIMTGIGAMFS